MPTTDDLHDPDVPVQDGDDNNNNNNASVNEDADLSEDASNNGLIIDALLTFIISILHSAASNIRMVELMCKYYDCEQIKRSKHLLCDAGRVKYENRNDSTKRTEKIAHATDIIDILRKLDKTKNIPCFVIDSIALATIPRINSEDISYISVAEQIADLNAKVNLMNSAIAENTIRSCNNAKYISTIQPSDTLNSTRSFKSTSTIVMSNTAPSTNIAAATCISTANMPVENKVTHEVPKPVPADATRETHGDTRHTHDARAIQDARDTSRTHDDEDAPDGRNQPGPDARYAQAALEAQQARDKSVNQQRQYSTVISSNDFEIPPEHIRRQKRQNRSICGVGYVRNSKVKGGPRPRRSLFVYRVESDTPDDDMKQYIERFKVPILEFEKMSHSDAVFKSFKVTLYRDDYFKLFEPHMWPSGVCVKPYIPPRTI